MLDRIKSFSISSHPQVPQQIERGQHASLSSEASITSGSESSNSDPGSAARMLSKPSRGSKSSDGGGGGGGRASALSSAVQRGCDTMGVSSSTNIRLNTIADDRLRSAAERFVSFRSKLRTLDRALRAHHSDLVRAQRSRSALTEALADAGRGTPLHDLVGRRPDPTDETSSESEVQSYAAVQREVTSSVLPHLDKYREETLVYVTEWEKTISTRIATELRHVRRLHTNFVKYHRKVESLRNAAAKKKDGPGESELSKIERNESKLRTAMKDYRRNLVAVTLLTEEVTDRGWKDLIPLVLMLIEYDVETTGRTAEVIMSKLTDVREETKELGRRFEMDYAGMTTGRLRVLLEEDATEFVSPDDMADIESIMPSIGTASVGTSTPGTFTRGASPPAVIPPVIQENPAAEQDSEVKVVAAQLFGDGDENDDSLSLDRPEPEGCSSPPQKQHHQQQQQQQRQQSSPKSPSAPPADLMSAVSRGKDVAQQEDEVQRRAREAAAAALPEVLRVQNDIPALPRALPPGNPGAAPAPPSPADLDDEQSKINYPSSIYFADANYGDDVTALTPYPDLVSI